MKSINIFFACISLVGCSGKSDKSTGYEYLNDEMKAELSVPKYKIVALEFQDRAHSEKLAAKRVGNILVAPDIAQVTVYPDHVYLDLTLEVSNQATHFEWSDTKTLDERLKVGNEICEAHIRRLAHNLKCDISSIKARWVCIEGNVDGKVEGSALAK